MAADSAGEVLVVEIDIPAPRLALFQALLQGENGLAVIRCFDPEKRKQQLWTTPSQRQALFEWLQSLPETLQPGVRNEWVLADQER